MDDKNSYRKEIYLLKDKLVNTSIIVAVLASLPLVISAILQSLKFNQLNYVIVYILVFITLVIFGVFRKKIKYELKASYVILLLLILAFSDFTNVGVLSSGYMWLLVAIIMSFLYFDLKRSIYTAAASILIVILIRYLIRNEILTFDLDFNEYVKTELILIIRSLNFILLGAVVVFSMRGLTEKFDSNIEHLGKQRLNLLNSAIRMRREIDYRKKSEQTALENEKKFRNIFESSSDAMVIVGEGRKIQDYNSTFVKMVEEDYEDLKGIDFIDLIPKSYTSFFEEIKHDIRLIPQRFDMVYKSEISGNRMFLDVTTSHVEYEGEFAVMAIFRDNTVKKNQERVMYSAALEAEERERLRMSKELHDGLGPLLSTLKIYYEALEKHPDNVEIQKRIKTIMNDSITSVKEISNNLSPYALQNLGVVKALRAFIDKIVYAGNLEISLDSNLEHRFNEKIEITIYRMITELLNNTIKHANASHVQISMIKEGSYLKIEYIDNGKGFDLKNQQNKTSGIGLFNMKSRIENFGGICSFYSADEEGFKLEAQIDVENV